MAVINDGLTAEYQGRARTLSDMLDNKIEISAISGLGEYVRLSPGTANEVARLLSYFSTLKLQEPSK